jgi:hypothetical protein
VPRATRFGSAATAAAFIKRGSEEAEAYIGYAWIF